MNLIELVEIRKRLEPMGITVEWKLADDVWLPMRKHVVMPGKMVCELRGLRGWAMIHRSQNGILYTAWNLGGSLRMESMRADSMEHCLKIVLGVMQ